MFQFMTFYAAELGQDVTVRNLSAKGVYRVDKVTRDIRSEKARNMAQVLEHLRDAMVDPALKTNDELMAFAEKYPDLTVRLFAAIRRLSG